jgi:hypothetical protein
MANNNQSLHPGQKTQARAAILAALPERHGTLSNPSRNVRRRLNKKWNAEEEAAIADGAAVPSMNSQSDPIIAAAIACLDPRYPKYNPPCQRGPAFLPDIGRDVTVYHAHIDQSQFPQTSPSGVPPSPDQDHAPEQSRGEGHGSAQRRDSRENRRTSNPLSPPQDSRKKPALSANSTSAEIVEALMPDRPAPVRFPRRTASVRYCEERKIALKISISSEFGGRRRT